MKGVEQELEGLSGSGGLGALAEAVLEGRKGGLDGEAALQDLAAEVIEGGADADDNALDVDEVGAEVDEVVIVAVDEVDQLVIEGGEMGSELRPEGVEGDEGPQIGDVRLRVELALEEGRLLEPHRVGVNWIPKHVRCRSRSHRQIRHSLSSSILPPSL